MRKNMRALLHSGHRSVLSSWPAIVAVVLLAQGVISLALSRGPALVAYYDISYFVLLLLTCGVAIRNAVQSRQAVRLFWSFLAAAFGLWALVPGSWFNSVVLHGRIPEFLFDNPPLFLHIVFMIAAVASRPHLKLPSRRPYRATLNFLILLFVWVFAYAFYLFPYQYGSRGTAMILRFEALYLIENVLLLGILGRLIVRSQSPWKSIYLHLFGASALYAIGSLAFNLVWALKGPLGNPSGANYPALRAPIGMAFTASIFWFLWIALEGNKLQPKLNQAVLLDTTDPKYSSVFAMLAVLGIPAVGIWELFRTDEPSGTHEVRLLVVMVAGLLLAAGAFAENYLANREFTSDVTVAHNRLRLAMGSGKSMGWDWDLVTGQNIWFGDLETTFGINADTYLAGEHEFLERIYPGDRERIARVLADAVQDRRPFRAEYRVVRPDGTIRWLADTGRFYLAANGDPQRALGIAVDVTDRRHAEDARREKEAELEKTEKLAKVGAWKWDVETDTVIWSEELYRIAGLDPAQPAPSYKDHPRLYTVESWARLSRAVEESLRSGTHYKLDLEMIRPDGATRWVIGRGEAIRDDNDRIAQLHGTVQDITERKQTEFALRESEERFRLVSNSAPVMIWMSDTDKLCTYFNRPWLDFTGRPLSSELGYGWAEGVHTEDLKRCLEIYDRAFDRREEFRMEYRLLRHDLIYRWVSNTGVPRFNSEGSFAGYIGSCTDVTEQRLAVEALSDVGSRLIKAQEQERTRIARELHDDISQRLALTVIELDGIKSDISNSNLSAFNRVAHLRNYTSEIAADLQALSHELHSVRLEHLGLAVTMRGFCQEFGEKHKMRIEFRCHDLPGHLPGDISLCLFRVLQEAAHNAAKHSGTPRLDVQCWGTPDEIQLAVTDAGVGFDPEAAAKGRGLGLFSMSERVRLVNGSISVNSKLLEGTEVHVRVPVKAPTGASSSDHTPSDSRVHETI
ncbi:MAG: PAS domain-containing protein [Terracidiphilus sp.]